MGVECELHGDMWGTGWVLQGMVYQLYLSRSTLSKSTGDLGGTELNCLGNDILYSKLYNLVVLFKYITQSCSLRYTRRENN